jgi:hypothetical protein
LEIAENERDFVSLYFRVLGKEVEWLKLGKIDFKKIDGFIISSSRNLVWEAIVRGPDDGEDSPAAIFYFYDDGTAVIYNPKNYLGRRFPGRRFPHGKYVSWGMVCEAVKKFYQAQARQKKIRPPWAA